MHTTAGVVLLYQIVLPLAGNMDKSLRFYTSDDRNYPLLGRFRIGESYLSEVCEQGADGLSGFSIQGAEYEQSACEATTGST